MPFRSVFASLFAQDTTIAGVVFGIILAAMILAFVLSWRRRRRGRPASKRSALDRVELVYALAILGIAIFLINASFSANAKDFPDPRPAVTVQVTGYQWCWRFHYKGQPVTVNGECGGGPVPTLVLPEDRPVRLEVTSADVVHAFWVPYLRFKTYAYPGHWNDFTLTLRHGGKWVGRCAQICGLLHYEMDFYVQAVPPAQFDRFLRARGGSPAAVSG